ncbi:MAG: EAL domain-containing protein, partial [Pseudomonadota bacterium]
LSKVIATDVSDYIAGRENVLARIAERQKIKSMDPDNCDPIIYDFRNFDPNFSNVVIVDKNGDVICSALPLKRKINYEKSKNFQLVKNAQDLVIGSPGFGKISERWILALNYPILDATGSFAGSIGAPIDLFRYSPISRETALPFDSYVLIIEESGQVVASSKTPRSWVGKSIYDQFDIDNLSHYKDQTKTVTDINGKQYLASVHVVGNTEWCTLFLMPKANILAEAKYSVQQQAVITIVVVIFVLIIGFIVASKIEKPIRQITTTAQLVANGLLDQRLKTGRVKEINNLAHQLNRMLEIRLAAENDIKKYSEHMRMAMHSANIATWNLQLDDQKLRFSANINTLLGLSKDYKITSLIDFEKLILEDDLDSFRQSLNNAINLETAFSMLEVRVVDEEGSIRWLSIKGNMFSDSNGNPEFLAGILMDITDRVRADEKLRFLATHDPMTNLVNRFEFETRLDQSIKSARYKNNQHAFLYLDLDQFKIVNDTCGHHAGDMLLNQLTGILKSQIRETDTIGRLGGDEFGILLDSCPIDDALNMAESLRTCVQDFRFVWDDKSFKIGVSIGLVMISDNNLSQQQIMSAADSACFIAKDKGRNRIHIHQPEDQIDAKHMGEMEWVSKINQAFEENRFCLFYQKIQHLAEESEGLFCEILLRMYGSNGEIIPPMAFIPAAERYGLMLEIDKWVIKQTFQYLGKDNNAFPQNKLAKISINISAMSINEVEFQEFVREQFVMNEIAADIVCFEITETAAISNLTQARELIKELRKLGISFALDDFGSGMSSFTYLKNLHIDYLKIDGSFVTDILIDPINLAMLESINKIGHEMGIQTIAEYAESQDILEKIKSLGVDYAQGSAIDKPKPISYFEQDSNKVISLEKFQA